MIRYHIIISHLTLIALKRAAIVPTTDNHTIHMHYLRMVKEWLDTLDMERRYIADPLVIDAELYEKIYQLVLTAKR